MANKLKTQTVSGDPAHSGNDTEELEKVREAALRILDYADNTSADLCRKLLRKGYRREIVEIVVDRLCDADLLNDIRFAEQYVRSKTEAGKGPVWIRRKLSEKGIRSEITEKALMEVSERSSERRRCLIKALEICGLKYDYEVDLQGNLRPVEDESFVPGEKKVFEHNVRNESNRVDIYREKEKAKAKMLRRLASAGFSQDAALFAIRRISDL